jgi:hypothetical protein
MSAGKPPGTSREESANAPATILEEYLHTDMRHAAAEKG